MEKAFELLPMVFAMIGLNILLGTFNSVELRNKVFSKSYFWSGIARAGVFTLGILALAWVLDAVDIVGSELTPGAILEATLLLYTTKVAIQLKDLFYPQDDSGADSTWTCELPEKTMETGYRRKLDDTVLCHVEPESSALDYEDYSDRITEVEDAEDLVDTCNPVEKSGMAAHWQTFDLGDDV